MKHYDYAPELQTVFVFLKKVKDTRRHEKLYANQNTPEDHRPILRTVYKNALKVALFNLSLALDKWAASGCKIENDDKEVEM